jgi:hypothetical protein
MNFRGLLSLCGFPERNTKAAQLLIRALKGRGFAAAINIRTAKEKTF